MPAGYNINFELTGDDEFIAALRSKADSVMAALSAKMESATDLLVDAIQVNLSGNVLQVRTGKLLSTVRKGPIEVSGGVIEGTVVAGGSDAPYGIMQELGGTRPYDIYPVNKKVLAFLADGKQIFTAYVNHPPLVKKGFVELAVAELEPEIIEGFREVVE
jgi:hypothetical protein